MTVLDFLSITGDLVKIGAAVQALYGDFGNVADAKIAVERPSTAENALAWIADNQDYLQRGANRDY